MMMACQNPKPKRKKIESGVSHELAILRKKQVSDVLYELSFTIPEDRTAPIAATLAISCTVNNLNSDLVLDFNEKPSFLHALVVNSSPVPIAHENQHIIIPKESLDLGENMINIGFKAGELSLNRNQEFLYTLLVPDRASTLFPCFDQPDIKAHYQLNVTAPFDWKVLCGAKEEYTIMEGNSLEHRFTKTDLMSTYLFSFVAGKFQETTYNPGAFPMRFLYRETDESKIAASTKTIFDTHQQALDFLSTYTQYEFPFQKMDFAAIPPFQYGGMEHTGAIQYRENQLFLNADATETRKLRRAKLIAHETSHMWFGNLVTMRWFDDVWMKEVFANFMADKIMNPVFPNTNHDLHFMMSHYPSAYAEDRTQGTHPIRQKLKNLKNAGSLYGRIIYNKAPIMMRQLEHFIGEAHFKKGIQRYMKTFANENADWNDLIRIFDEISPKNVSQWSDVWVNSASRPLLSENIEYKDDHITSFQLFQKSEDGTPKLWPQQFSIGLVYKDSIHEIPVSVLAQKTKVQAAIGLPKPQNIIYNYNGLGYGVFPLNTKAPKSIKDDTARGYAYINLYENALNGNMAITEVLKYYIDGLKIERNELILNYITGRINQLYWYFLTPKERETFNTLPTTVQQLMDEKNPKNIQKTLYNLLVNIGHTDKGKSVLYNIWKGDYTPKNLTLTTPDYMNLACNLAIYEHPKAEEILRAQKERIHNKDRKERFEWLLPSLSKDEKERDNFMLSFQEASNREKESWVVTALNHIHHPLRQKSSIKHLELCLDLLEEVQRTGDIFFPKRWLAGSIGNYRSEAAHQIVEKFIGSHPDLNPSLRKKLLMVSDNLHRIQAH